MFVRIKTTARHNNKNDVTQAKAVALIRVLYGIHCTICGNSNFLSSCSPIFLFFIMHRHSWQPDIKCARDGFLFFVLFTTFFFISVLINSSYTSLLFSKWNNNESVIKKISNHWTCTKFTKRFHSQRKGTKMK